MNTSPTTQANNVGLVGKALKRKLRFYWLIDISFSMDGWKIQTVNDSVKNALGPIRAATQGKVDVLMYVITFGKDASWKVGPKPEPVETFKWTDLEAPDGSTATAKAINLLCEELDIEKLGRRNVPPVAILMSDGYCTDSTADYEGAIARLNGLPFGKKAVRISIGIGKENEYDKTKLDEFISPYLRKNDNLETFQASDATMLAKYIKVISETASEKSSKSNPEDLSDSPIHLKKQEIEDKVVDENVVF